MMRKLGKLWLWIVYAFLFLPIFVVIAYSFNAAKYTSAWKGFTLKWYSQLFGNAALIDAVVNHAFRGGAGRASAGDAARGARRAVPQAHGIPRTPAPARLPCTS